MPNRQPGQRRSAARRSFSQVAAGLALTNQAVERRNVRCELRGTQLCLERDHLRVRRARKNRLELGDVREHHPTIHDEGVRRSGARMPCLQARRRSSQAAQRARVGSA